MQHFKFLLLCLIAFTKVFSDIDPEEIDKDWLIHSGDCPGAGDFLPHFETIFQEMKVRTLLQFGVGYETKYFLDHATKVISLEFVNPGYGPDWIKRYLNLFRDFSNWIPIVYFSSYQGDVTWAPFRYLGSEHLYKAAAYQCSTHKHYALNDPFYRTELDTFVGNLVKYNNIDVAFIAPPIYLRGDFVEILFGKVPLIIAHGTSVRKEGILDDVYGYSRIKTPDNYEEIYLAGGNGTTIWIFKTAKYQSLIEKLKKDTTNS